jgi:hypothetical protein
MTMTLLRGFDISAYQGASAPAADFIFVKATEGATYTNAKYGTQIASARARAKVVGAYHFARPEASSAASQADRFLAVAKPGPRDLLCLDLEASDLSQAKTNAWAIAFAARLKERVPGNRRVIYMGSGYASNGTGRDLSDHFSYWWYPQYPTAESTSTWPATFSPWLPSGLTCGWSKPHIWQFSSAYRGTYDANISTLTLDQLTGSGEQPTPLEDDMASAVSLGSGACTVPAGGSASIGWTTESTDKHKWAGPGDDGKTYSIYPDGPYWMLGSGWVRLAGLKDGDAVDLAFSLMKKDAKGAWTVASDPWRVKKYGNGADPIEFDLNGQIGVTKDTPVRVRIYSQLAYPLTVQSAVWRATFLKY